MSPYSRFLLTFRLNWFEETGNNLRLTKLGLSVDNWEQETIIEAENLAEAILFIPALEKYMKNEFAFIDYKGVKLECEFIAITSDIPFLLELTHEELQLMLNKLKDGK